MNIYNAFDELKNAIWMLVVPLIFGTVTLIGAVQWMIQDQLWTDRLSDMEISSPEIIQRVDESKCTQPKPAGYGHICAQSVDWWSPTDSTDCEGGQCYQVASLKEFISILEEWESSYTPILIPGLIPLILLLVVIRKISKARRAMLMVDDWSMDKTTRE